MNNIEKFTPKVCKQVDQEINKVLTELGDKLGLRIDLPLKMQNINCKI